MRLTKRFARDVVGPAMVVALCVSAVPVLPLAWALDRAGASDRARNAVLVPLCMPQAALVFAMVALNAATQEAR